MTEAKNLEPREFRFISRQEAATMLGCSYQTVCNWIESGILKGRKIERAEMVDRDTVEALFDTATEVIQMENKLQRLKSEISEELIAREKEFLDLRDDKLYLLKKQFLRSLIDNSVSIANDVLDDEDCAIVKGYLQGKSTNQIASELNTSIPQVVRKAKKSMPVLLSRLDYSDLREENRRLNEELSGIQEEIATLREKDKSENISRKIKGTPFVLGLSRFDFPVRIANILSNMGCKNLTDVLKLDLDYCFRRRKISINAIHQLESCLAKLGLYSGMDLDALSDSDFDAIVEKLKQKTIYTAEESDSTNQKLQSIPELKNHIKELQKSKNALEKEYEEHLKASRRNEKEFQKSKNAIEKEYEELLKASRRNEKEFQDSKNAIEREYKENLKASRKNENELKKQIDLMRRELGTACSKLSEIQETVDHLVEEIKNFNEVELQKIMPDDSDSANKYKSLYEFKLESMNLWKKTLEADLAASRSVIKAQKAIIDRLQVEKDNYERIKEKV